MANPRLRRLSILLALCFIALATSDIGKAQDTAPRPADPFAVPATDEGLPGVGPIRRYDWFQQLWRERRSAWAKTRANDAGAVVFLGD
jgi:hypothetical protein